MNKIRSERDAKAVSSYWGKSLKDRDWYSMNTSEGQTEVLIYDVIGWPFIDANTFTRELSRIRSKEITIGINSPGGDVFDGNAILGAIERHPARIITRIDGVAASMASIVALGGDEVQIAESAYFMMHNPWTIAMGDYRDFKKEFEILEDVAGTMAKTYSDRASVSIEEARSMMDAETWISGQKLVDQGFADKVSGRKKAKNKFDMSMYANAPKEIIGERATANGGFRSTITSIREYEDLVRDVLGYSKREAKRLASGGWPALAERDVRNDDQILEAVSDISKRTAELKSLLNR